MESMKKIREVAVVRDEAKDEGKLKNILRALDNNDIKCVLVNTNNSITVFFDEDTKIPKPGIHHIATILKGG